MPDTTKSCVAEMPLGAMISIINRTHFVALNEQLRPLGLSAGQFPILLCLIKKQNVMQDTLARHFRIDKGAIARAVTKLEDAGYVKRIVDPGDRRAVRLFLTPKGEEIASVIEQIDHEWEELMYSCIRPEDRPQFYLLIRRIADSCCESLKKAEAG
ncbi:MarR family winged helix-turn-helix transcriptional regulator [Methanoregula sp.]|uniref:MarR family winged helix-turn-helix transcriptional regulator n=1 Tax=Methanoregula sp. TaxID=2052170 RepID=UPI003568FF30